MSYLSRLKKLEGLFRPQPESADDEQERLDDLVSRTAAETIRIFQEHWPEVSAAAWPAA